MNFALFKQPRFWILTLLVLLSVVVAETSYRKGWAELVEHAYSDFWHQKSDVRHKPEHVVLVVMDDPTLAMYPDDPLVFWTPHIARGVEVLRKAGAKVIGLDFLYAISPEAWLKKMTQPDSEISRTYDLPFRNEISNGQMVMVGSMLPSQPYDNFLLPHTDYLLAIPDFDLTNGIGLADLLPDDDGIIRSFVTAQSIKRDPQKADEPAPRLNLGALLAVRATGQDPAAASWTLGGRTISPDSIPVKIGYAGPPKTIPRIPLGDLIKPDAEQNPNLKLVKDKVVIIGGEFLGMNDWHATPYTSRLLGTGTGNLMTGPEVQANIVETLLSGKSNQPVATPWRLAYFIIAILLAVLIYERHTPWHGLLTFIGVSSVAAALSFFLFQRFLVLPVADLQLGLLVGYLGVYGKRLTSEERRRTYVTQVFSRYISAEMVDEILKDNQMPDLGGESLQVSILFSDIRNFTTISEKLNAHEVVEMLNTYFENACAAVLAEGGTIDKFIGDAIMVRFGSPVRHPDHAMRAVRAALAMDKAAKEFQGWMAQRFAGRGLPDFAIGIGIHTGEAVIGNIGSSKRIEYTAIGDTVNTASRLEGVTKNMGCSLVISQETLDATQGQVLTGKHESMQVKGRAQAVDVYEVIGIKTEGHQHETTTSH